MKSSILKLPKLSKYMEFIISVVIPVFLIFAVNQRVGIFFETNDDRFIMSLLAGVMTGEPDSHPFFLNYFLWLPLQGLYHITNDVPWYGIFLIVCWLVSLTFVLYCAIDKCKSLISQFVVIVLSVAVFLSFIYALGLIEFTSTAALLAVSGYVCLIIDNEGKINSIFFFILEMFACFLRPEAMFMVQPLGMLAFAFVYLNKWYEKRTEEKRFKISSFIRKFVKPIVMLVCVFVVSFFGVFLSYQTDGWGDFRSFSGARSLLYDYCEKVPYGEVASMLEKYDVSEAKYDAFWTGVIMDWEHLTDCVEELAEYSDVKRERISIGTALWNAWNESVVNISWNINHVIWIAWILLLAGIIYKKYWYLLIPAGLFAVARMAIWTYLCYNGRLPMRVAISMFMTEIVLIMTLSLYLWMREDIDPAGVVILMLLSVVFINQAFLAGQSEYRYVSEQNRGQAEYVQGMREVMNYCNERDSECFLLEPVSFSHYKGNVFDVSLSQPFNALYIGGWFYPAPNVQAQLEDTMDAADGFSVIVYESIDWENAPLRIYLEENTGVLGQHIDSFEASFGGMYEVYRFERNFVFE